MYDVCLGLIVKDDVRVLREWLAYHVVIGVQHFWIAINDVDPSDTFNMLQPFIHRGLVHAFHIEGFRKQRKAYNDILRLATGKTKWLGFLDSDEFIHLRHMDNLPQFMQQYELDDVAALAVRWRIFGSNWHRTIQASVLEAYTRRAEDDFPVNAHLKLLVRPSHVESMLCPHSTAVKEGYRMVDENLTTLPNATPLHQGTANLIRINHYFCRSVEDFARKIWRGRADFDQGDTSHYNWQRFIDHDMNNIPDKEILRHMPRVRSLVEEICGRSL